jgi:hypothetical protein
VLLDGLREGHVGLTLESREVLLEVLADAEGPAAPGEHHAPHLRVVGDLVDGVAQEVLGGDVETVHGLGTVERDGRDAVLDVEQDGRLGGRHGRSLPDEHRVSFALWCRSRGSWGIMESYDADRGGQHDSAASFRM